MAFMKVSDLSMAGESDDPLASLLKATTAHNFERSVLEHCRGSNLDKVVTALDFGSQEVIVDGVRDLIFYIIFELADGDLRKYVEVEQGNDLLWVLSAVHNLAIAMRQLHSIDVFHNDLKPANALVFGHTEKVADFGRATSPKFPVAHDYLLCAGDQRFAPPEQLYHVENNVVSIDRFLKARTGDLYNLGSMIHFLITKRMITPEVILRLDEPFKPRQLNCGWCESYEGALPYWRQAFSNLMTEFSDDLPSAWGDKYRFAIEEVGRVVHHLCDPDFRLRGDLTPSLVSTNKYSLEKIISRLDNLQKRVLVISRAR